MIRTVIQIFGIVLIIFVLVYAQDTQDVPDSMVVEDSSETISDSVVVEESTELITDSITVADSTEATSDSANAAYALIAADSSWWYRKIDNKAFGLGERLEFSVKYGKIPAGTAIMEVADSIDYDGHGCYDIKSIAHSNSVVSVFYKVRDTVQTIVDIDGIFPRKFRKKLKEGGYKIDRSILFDQKNHWAIVGTDTIPTYAFVQDALSSLYYARTQTLTPGDSILIDSHTSKKNFPLKLNVLRREKVKVPAGEFDCIVVEPVMRADGIFKAKGRIWIWLTDDQFKMPILMQTEVFFLGSVSARLKKFTRGEIGIEVEQTQTD